MLIAALLIHTGNTAAIGTHAFVSSSLGKATLSAANELPDLNSMTTELNNRSAVLEKEILDLCDLPVIQKRLAQMAKETKSLSRELKLFKHTSQYGYDALFDVNARIDQRANDLKEIIRTTDEAINQLEL